MIRGGQTRQRIQLPKVRLSLQPLGKRSEMTQSEEFFTVRRAILGGCIFNDVCGTATAATILTIGFLTH